MDKDLEGLRHKIIISRMDSKPSRAVSAKRYHVQQYSDSPMVMMTLPQLLEAMPVQIFFELNEEKK